MFIVVTTLNHGFLAISNSYIQKSFIGSFSATIVYTTRLYAQTFNSLLIIVSGITSLHELRNLILSLGTAKRYSKII